MTPPRELREMPPTEMRGSRSLREVLPTPASVRLLREGS
jgi:hypothetical protein